MVVTARLGQVTLPTLALAAALLEAASENFLRTERRVVIGDTITGDLAPAGAPSVPNESSDLVTDNGRRRTAFVPNVLQELADDFTALDRLRAEWQAEIAQLETAGMYDEVPGVFWGTRKGGGHYLRLVFPQRDGKRRSVYIGADPSAIAEAEAKVARRKRYDELSRKLYILWQMLRKAEWKLLDVERELGGHLRSLGQMGGWAGADHYLACPQK